MKPAYVALLVGWLAVGLVPRFGPSARAEEQDAGARPTRDAGAVRSESTTPYVPEPSASTNSAPRDVRLKSAPGARVVRVPIDGTIDLGLSAFIGRVLKNHADVAAFVFDINTLGGRVDAAIQIRDALLDTKVPTVAYVHPRAISAGALIALACDVIAVGTGASIGAATPVQLDAGGAKPVEEKMVSYFRIEMRTTAEANRRRGDVAEAMVDSSVSIPGLIQAGKLLTLDNQAALKLRIADFQATDFGDLLAQLGLQASPVEQAGENWAEDVVRFLTDPVVSGLLMSLGTLGILIELYTPGVGLAGALGLLCLLSFFGGHLLVKLAGLEELLLFVLGLLLVALEAFVVPGFGMTGVAGLLCIFAALILTLIGLPLDVTLSTGAWVEPASRVSLALLVTTLFMIVAARFLPRSRAGRTLILQSATDRAAGFTSAPDQAGRMGQRGVAECDLRPGGVARIGDERVDVVTEGAYVAAGSRIRVIEVTGMRVVVRAEPNEPPPET